MKHFTAAIAALFIALVPSMAIAETPEKPWRYVDARELRIVNKGFDDSKQFYWRIPAELEDSVRAGLWDRQKESAGFAVRFTTNSSRIGVRYKLLANAHMPHMADTGIKGTDLYVFEGDSVWRHANTNRPANRLDQEAQYMERLDSTRMTEYMVYLPLYDGIENIEIKVSPYATITPGDSSVIDANKRIVAYGTSIMQGGCASRTGMASTNILSRELNSEVINLGFSGQGKMDSCMARAIARIPDVDLFLLDPVPNCTEAMCDSLTYGFVNIIRAAHPKTPIVMVEGPIYPYARYDSFFGNYLPAKNARYRENFERLKADFPDAPLYYVDSVNLDGVEDDGTVDGIHLTDLGFVHYVDKVLPVIRQALAESPLKK